MDRTIPRSDIESEEEMKEGTRLDRVLKILAVVAGYIGYRTGLDIYGIRKFLNSRKLDEEKESKLRFAASKRPIAFAKSSRKYFDYLRRIAVRTAGRVCSYSASTASFEDLSQLTSG